MDKPYTLAFSEHDLRHLRMALRDRAIESTDWGRVRCAVGIYDRINEQLTDEQKNILSGLPAPARGGIRMKQHEHELREMIFRVRAGSQRDGISPEAACALAELLDAEAEEERRE